jgi:hypothetical protein
MHELKKTAIYAVVAVVLLATAWFTSGSGAKTASEEFRDQGQKFFPELTVPEQATALEVVEYDQSTGTALPFKVALENGRWVIPSHYDYPADAKDRLARTAAGVIDLTKDTIRSDRPEDHKEMGVLDPRDPKATSPDGLGRRVTLRDKSGQVLADLIIGKEIPGSTGQRFVRVPEQNRVYGVKLDNVDLSTRFSDWIETNLLKVQPPDIREVTVSSHKVDPERGTIDPGEVLTVERPDSGTGWALKQGLPPDKEVDTTALSTLTSTLGDLKIVGVRPKPAGLTAELKSDAEGGIKLTRAALNSLAGKGFHLVQGRLLSNEGDVYTTTADGIEYTLRFGEVTFARGEALSAGSEEESASATPEPKPDDAVESRYLFVTARFNPDVIPKPQPHRVWADGELPDDIFARTPSEHSDLLKLREAAEQREKEDYEKKLADGRKRAKELSDLFAEWYYVVPGDAYRKIILDRAHLTRTKGQTPPAAPPDFPGLPGLGGSSPPGGGLGGFHP